MADENKLGDVQYPGGPNPPVGAPKAFYWKDALMSKNGNYDTKDVKPIKNYTMYNGEGLNATPFEAEERINFTFLIPGGTGWWMSLMFQLPKWGFVAQQVSHSIEVSTAYAEYYATTIEQKEKLEQKIKAGFASLSQSVSDYELIAHDLRKYKDILGFYRELAIGEKKLKDALEGEGDEKIQGALDEIKEANHTFRAMFVDQVDVHTGDGISLRSIAPRWPTIIADFMKMKDDYGVKGEEELLKAISEELKITKAEAVILITKNKLYLNWRNGFIDIVKERYKHLKWLADMRKKSIDEYRNQIRPLLSRYKSFKDARQVEGATGNLDRIRFYMPSAQPSSYDETEVWAFRPYTPPDTFKASREMKNEVSLEEAGFRADEIKFLKSNETKKYTSCKGLPILPIMDDPLRCVIQQLQIKYPKADITLLDLMEEIENLQGRFVYPKAPKAIGFDSVGGVRWIASPYYVFLKFVMGRAVGKMPNGPTLEDMDGTFYATMISQNILLGKFLELRALSKQVEAEIKELLGEEIANKNIGEILKEDFPEIQELMSIEDETKKKPKKRESFLRRFFGIKPKEKKKKEEDEKPRKRMKESFNDFRRKIADFFNKVLGFELLWMYPGHYETLMYGRIARMYQLGAGRTFGIIRSWMQATGGVPGKKKPSGIPAQ